jgi:NADPH-dependent F420 reductase
MQSIGIMGATGKQGRGLALRLALAGHPVRVGSRDAGRAAQGAEQLGEDLAKATAAAMSPPAVGEVASGDYAACTECDIVVVAVPFDGLEPALAPLAPRLADRVVVSCVNALGMDGDGPYPHAVVDGSAAQLVQRLAGPTARVIGAFQNIAAGALLDAPLPVTGDVLITGDDPAARQQIAALAAEISALRPVDVGPLRLSRPVEEITAVQLAVNRTYKVTSTLRLEGLGG